MKLLCKSSYSLITVKLYYVHRFSLNRASVILDYYEGFLGVNYSLPKQDLVVIYYISLKLKDFQYIFTFYILGGSRFLIR